MTDVDSVSTAVKQSEDSERGGGNSDTVSVIVALHCSVLVSVVLNVMMLQVQAKFILL
jgi:hypothetical protein